MIIDKKLKTTERNYLELLKEVQKLKIPNREDIREIKWGIIKNEKKEKQKMEKNNVWFT